MNKNEEVRRARSEDKNLLEFTVDLTVNHKKEKLKLV